MIIHGNKNFGYAPITEGAFGTPVMLPGLVGVEIEVEQSNTTVYADDRSFCVLKGAKVRTATATFRYVSKEYAELLGFHQNTNGMLTDSGSYPTHCVFFETTMQDCDAGKTYPRLHYLYAVTGSEPSFESATDEDEAEAQEIEVEYSATESSIAKDDQGISVQYGYIDRTEENAGVYDTFKSKVLLPTSEMQ